MSVSSISTNPTNVMLPQQQVSSSRPQDSDGDSDGSTGAAAPTKPTVNSMGQQVGNTISTQA